MDRFVPGNWTLLDEEADGLGLCITFCQIAACLSRCGAPSSLRLPGVYVKLNLISSRTSLLPPFAFPDWPNTVSNVRFLDPTIEESPALHDRLTSKLVSGGLDT